MRTMRTIKNVSQGINGGSVHCRGVLNGAVGTLYVAIEFSVVNSMISDAHSTMSSFVS